ncbi:hypothetical protein AQPE_4386 [Aquipluma nitroreducens]|uniref:Mobile element protein n=1 Tax=Aquipluma nitroreducens TaxID=2010828 RepID=A0A5K7SFD3_9BACT|nr:hypothetical protein AQPE_4386 [Aquipluma nitroreducens]
MVNLNWKWVVNFTVFSNEDTAHTITSDNGSVFAQHELIAKKLNADFYFAHPYSS